MNTRKRLLKEVTDSEVRASLGSFSGQNGRAYVNAVVVTKLNTFYYEVVYGVKRMKTEIFNTSEEAETKYNEMYEKYSV